MSDAIVTGNIWEQFHWTQETFCLENQFVRASQMQHSITQIIWEFPQRLRLTRDVFWRFAIPTLQVHEWVCGLLLTANEQCWMAKNWAYCKLAFTGSDSNRHARSYGQHNNEHRIVVSPFCRSVRLRRRAIWFLPFVRRNECFIRLFWAWFDKVRLPKRILGLNWIWHTKSKAKSKAIQTLIQQAKTVVERAYARQLELRTKRQVRLRQYACIGVHRLLWILARDLQIWIDALMWMLSLVSPFGAFGGTSTIIATSAHKSE